MLGLSDRLSAQDRLIWFSLRANPAESSADGLAAQVDALTNGHRRARPPADLLDGLGPCHERPSTSFALAARVRQFSADLSAQFERHREKAPIHRAEPSHVIDSRPSDLRTGCEHLDMCLTGRPGKHRVRSSAANDAAKPTEGNASDALGSAEPGVACRPK